MWGRHVEFAVHDATKDLKTTKQRATKAKQVMNNLLTPKKTESSSGSTKGQFRDPATMYSAKG